ncbi:NmrA-like family protein [Paramyrothecium foliicola]|nr:NmrA-like family protein [Paramyrothecium foliicola]
MVTVAVAGGTGNVGRTLVEAIVAAGQHKVIILSRKADQDLERQLGAPIVAVDYTNTEALTKILEDHNVHTIVSGLSMLPAPGGPPPGEVALIQAADASRTTKRIVSSDWGAPFQEGDASKLASIPLKAEAHAQLEKTKDLQWTVVHNGYFLDYFGIPKVKSHMQPVTLILDIPHHRAAIPGTGDTPVIFTHTTDVAKYVVALLDADSWGKVSNIVGDRVTLNQFLRLAEAATGAKFDVTHDSVEKLQKGEITELPNHIPAYQFFPKQFMQPLLATFALWMEQGRFNYHTPNLLNDQFPNIKPMTVEEVLNKAWAN